MQNFIFECRADTECQLSTQLLILLSLLKYSDESQSQGQLLIQTVKLAFSVTNNVIRLKPPSSVVSPLEQALTQHGMYSSTGTAWEAVVLLLLSVCLVTDSMSIIEMSKMCFVVIGEG